MERLCRGPATVGELAAPFEMALPSFSKHLKVLEEAGLIEREKRGRAHHIRLAPAALPRVAAWLAEHRPEAASRPPVAPARLFSTALLPPAPTGGDREAVLRKAEALQRELQTPLEVVQRALAHLAGEDQAPDAAFAPSAHSARLLAHVAGGDAAVARQLREAAELYATLDRFIRALRAGGDTAPLRDVIFPLSRLVHSWQEQPRLRDAFPHAEPKPAGRYSA